MASSRAASGEPLQMFYVEGDARRQTAYGHARSCADLEQT
jgi:hypothetical protein